MLAPITMARSYLGILVCAATIHPQYDAQRPTGKALIAGRKRLRTKKLSVLHISVLTSDLETAGSEYWRTQWEHAVLRTWGTRRQDSRRCPREACAVPDRWHDNPELGRRMATV